MPVKQTFDQVLYDYALRWVNVPYIFGGESFAGVDCSGLVRILLHAGGITLKDMTAQGLLDYFTKNGYSNVWGFGSLSFFGKSVTAVEHVGFCLDERRMIHAAHGDSTIKTLMDAERRGAFVRVSPIRYRNDFLCVLMPMYPGRAPA